MSQNKPLTAKQEAFCLHYVANGFNATQAAISAGYAEESADVEGMRQLGKARVKERIAELKKPMIEKAKITAEELAKRIDESLDFDFTEWFDVDERGELRLKCKLSEIPQKVRKTIITGFKQTKYGLEVQFVPKQFLIDTQARFLSMYKDTVTVKQEGDLTPEEREELEALQARRKANESRTP